MTHDQSKQALSAAEDADAAAVAEFEGARDGLRKATAALRPEDPGGQQSRDQVIAREQAVHRARSAVAQAEAKVRRAAAALKEAQERHAALAPHAATLQKLEKLRSALAKADQDLTAEGAAFLARFSGQVRSLGKLVDEADALLGTIPAAVRFPYVTHPCAAAAVWGRARPDSTELLVILARALAATPTEGGRQAQTGARA